MKKKTTKSKNIGNPVLITTEFRGVFYGRIKKDSKLPAEITISKARNCIYWAAKVGGFAGLASVGPNHECRIGAPVDEITIYKITAVVPVTKAAAKNWDEATTYGAK